MTPDGFHKTHMKLLTVQQMKLAEATVEAAGLSYARMMDKAGSAVAQEIARRESSLQGRNVLILAGPGNNGGDGLVAARFLHDLHARVQIFLWQPRPDTDTNFREVRERNIPIFALDDDTGLVALRGACKDADIIVDALLGTGAARPIEGTMKAMLDAVRVAVAERPSPPLIVAVDVPSGLNADTGALDPTALPADVTVTFAFPKRGHYLFPGAAAVGDLVVADIGIPSEIAGSVALDLAEPDRIAEMLPERPRNANKGTFGKVLVLAGCANYTGAAYLASMAAYRVGAGLVTLALARSLHPILAVKTSEVTFLPLPEAEPGYLSEDGLAELLDALPRYDTLLVGCGLGAHPRTRLLVQRLLAALTALPALRLVIDADGLNALASDAKWWQSLPPAAVLTPHPGEMARLSGLSVAEIESDRIGVALAKAALWQQVVVLKGAYTVIAAPDGQATINPFANPAMATAGSGDVLAGAITGLLAQGDYGETRDTLRVSETLRVSHKMSRSYSVAVCGAFVHALAGQVMTQSFGDSGMVAGDLLSALPLAIKALRQPPEADE